MEPDGPPEPSGAALARLRVDGLAALQIVSGLFNLLVMTWVSTAVAGVGTAVLGALATCLCPVGLAGTTCGLWPFALVPIGVLEVVTGVLALARRPAWPALASLTATAEVVSVAFGGLGSFVVGLVALRVLREDEVQQELRQVAARRPELP